ncbi:membrane hypothetical protein [Candidatus Sulfopaludibacter sp. SbA4]|nr:membrane hypothetical protein [Candidatus Sulfopaludibacter sp. SbA4]
MRARSWSIRALVSALGYAGLDAAATGAGVLLGWLAGVTAAGLLCWVAAGCGGGGGGAAATFFFAHPAPIIVKVAIAIMTSSFVLFIFTLQYPSYRLCAMGHNPVPTGFAKLRV